jgi:alpha-tubulin suppressor-like RCC1 family protein
MISRTNTTVSAGQDHSLIIDPDGHVWSAGRNDYGQLGLTGAYNRNQFNMIPDLPLIKSISGKYAHNLLLDENGQVWSFGVNSDESLGYQIPASSSPTPRLIPNISGITAVEAGQDHSLILDEHGMVWSFGSYRVGQLGRTVSHLDALPYVVIPNLPVIVKMSVGYQFSLLLDEQGQVWSFGSNTEGQFGLGSHRSTPIQMTNIPTMVDISAGQEHSLLLDADGQVWGFGSNDHGQLGITGVSRQLIPIMIPGLGQIQAISAGAAHSLVITSSGQVWGFGSNGYGALGLGLRIGRSGPVFLGLTDIVEVSAGFGHSLFVNSAGRVSVVGYNQFRQLGLGLHTTLVQQITTLNNLTAMVS